MASRECGVGIVTVGSFRDPVDGIGSWNVRDPMSSCESLVVCDGVLTRSLEIFDVVVEWSCFAKGSIFCWDKW